MRSDDSGPAEGPLREPTEQERIKKLEDMKCLLIERRTILQGTMERSLHADRMLSAAVKGDASDLATSSLDSDLALRLAEGGTLEMAQIDKALRRIDEGTYGRCESCGCDIPWGRIEALPCATLCVQCRRRQELASRGNEGVPGWSVVDEFESLEQE